MSKLPDIALNTKADQALTLHWVGMEKIAIPVTVETKEQGPIRATAKANVFVSLDDPNAKGIHMSRLYALANDFAEGECNKHTMDALINEVLHSQGGLSKNAKICLEFDLVLKKPALLSDGAGYQAYPVKIEGQSNGSVTNYKIHITIPYSSTCPCSAALSRQAHADAVEHFLDHQPEFNQHTLLDWLKSTAGSIATPHSQRSFAYIKIAIDSNKWPSMDELILKLESAIGTPVQTAVKRTDEQEFARLNAQKLMFCEDAARRIKQSLDELAIVSGYWLQVEHQESLHAHNAVAIAQKFPERLHQF